MAVKSLAPYEFESRSRQELYGDDQLVNVWWADNPLFCSAATFRAPKAMTWADFTEQMVKPWASADPDFDPNQQFVWRLEGEQINPEPTQTLTELGVGHKYTLSMTAN